jgi:hypothetical protein
MLSLGYRVRAIAGAHEAPRRLHRGDDRRPSTFEFQRIRRRRTKSEYEDITIGRADLTADLAHAEAIILAVRAAL